MAAKRKAAKAGAKGAKAGATTAYAKSNPYVQRLIEDEDLRDNIREAYESARTAYGRLNNGKAPAKALLDDKKLHKDLKRSAESLRDASNSLRDGGKSGKRKGGIGRLLLLSIVGGAIALAASEGLRNKVLDALFGAEEEFDYTSTTSPSSPPAATVPG